MKGSCGPPKKGLYRMAPPDFNDFATGCSATFISLGVVEVASPGPLKGMCALVFHPSPRRRYPLADAEFVAHKRSGHLLAVPPPPLPSLLAERSCCSSPCHPGRDGAPARGRRGPAQGRGGAQERHGRDREGRRREPRRERDRAGGHRRRTQRRGSAGQERHGRGREDCRWVRHRRRCARRRRSPAPPRRGAGWRGGSGQWRGRHAGMARAWWAWRGRGAGMARAWRGRGRGHVLWPLATLSPWQAYKPRIKPPT
eukprot:gene1937-biopygen6399